MKKTSLVCPITSDPKDKERILNEAESFAKYLGLSAQASSQMRLMTEELLGLAEVVTGPDNGTFWIEETDDGYEIHSEIRGDIYGKSNAMLINTSTDKKNAAYKGISGKFREICDILSKYSDAASMTNIDNALAGIDISYGFSKNNAEWTLEKYREEAAREEIIDGWDGMENLILTKFADNIIVSARNKQADITIKVKN